MPEFQTLLVFAAPALVLLVIPGPAIAYLAARSLAQGPVAGIVSSIGLCAGLFVHVAASVAGVSAIAAQWPLALQTLQIAGGGYLLWLGVAALRKRGAAVAGSRPAVVPRSLRRLFWDGVLVNVLNPKPALFFLAFLPQFVDPTLATSVRIQLLGLGVFLVGLGLLVNSSYAIIFGLLGEKLRYSGRSSRLQNSFSGGLLLMLGIWALINGFETQVAPSQK